MTHTFWAAILTYRDAPVLLSYHNTTGKFAQTPVLAAKTTFCHRSSQDCIQSRGTLTHHLTFQVRCTSSPIFISRLGSHNISSSQLSRNSHLNHRVPPLGNPTYNSLCSTAVRGRKWLNRYHSAREYLQLFLFFPMVYVHKSQSSQACLRKSCQTPDWVSVCDNTWHKGIRFN